MATAGEVKVVFAADTAQMSAAIVKVRSQIEGLQGTSTKAAHATVQPWQAASAAIRVFEGNVTNNIRAAERFVASIGPLRNVLVSAFPVVGAVALAGVFGEMAMRLQKFIEQAREVPRALQRGFEQMNASALVTVDDLRKSNDELQNQIDKLQGRPQNNLALALDEARIAADKLEQSLAADNEKMDSLMKQHAVGGIAGGLFSGQYRTAGSAGSINYFNQSLADEGHAFNMAVHDFGPDSPQAQEAQRKIDATRKDAERWVAGRIAEVRKWIDKKASTSNLDMLQGFQAQLDYQQDVESLNAQHEPLEKKRDALQHAKDLEEFQKKQLAAATKLSNELNAQRKQYDEMRQQFEQTDGSASFFQLIPLVNAQGKPGKAATGLPLLPDDLSKGDNSNIQQSSRVVTEYLKHLNEGVAIEQKNADAIAAMSLQIEMASGRMSRFDAAQAMAAMHTQEFADAMRLLDQRQQALDAADYLTPEERAEKQAQINNQRALARGEYGVTQMQDTEAIRSATALGTFSDALAHTTQRLEDWSAKGAQLFDQTLGSVNDEIVHALTTRDHQKAFEFGNIGANLGRGIMGIGLEKMEGDVLKALGFGGGKPDGSASKPFHVVMGAVSAAGSAVSNDIGGLFGKILHVFHIPGFAEGGSIPSNMPAIVGERGPELFIPSTAGHIVPNHRLLGGGHTFNIPVDARGATDPAQVKAAARSAVREAIPAILQASLAASREERVRTPSMNR
jgi:hypothetical protein